MGLVDPPDASAGPGARSVLGQERRRDLRLRFVASLARVEEGDGRQRDLHRVVLVGQGLDDGAITVEVGRRRRLARTVTLLVVAGQAFAQAGPQELESTFAQVGDRGHRGPLQPRPGGRLDVQEETVLAWLHEGDRHPLPAGAPGPPDPVHCPRTPTNGLSVFTAQNVQLPCNRSVEDATLGQTGRRRIGSKPLGADGLLFQMILPVRINAVCRSHLVDNVDAALINRRCISTTSSSGIRGALQLRRQRFVKRITRMSRVSRETEADLTSQRIDAANQQCEADENQTTWLHSAHTLLGSVKAC